MRAGLGGYGEGSWVCESLVKGFLDKGNLGQEFPWIRGLGGGLWWVWERVESLHAEVSGLLGCSMRDALLQA